MFYLSAATAAETYEAIRSLGPVDIRGLLGSVQAPVLVLHRTGDQVADVRASRYMAERIPGARFVELPGDAHLPFFGDQDTVVELTQEFLTGAAPVIDPDRVLATVLFTDIVDSTRRAAELGDRRWHRLLDDHQRWCAGTWPGSVAARSRPPGTGSWPPSTGRPGPSGPPTPSGPGWRPGAGGPGGAAHRRGASCSTTTSAGSPSTSPPGSWRRRGGGDRLLADGQGPGRRGRLRLRRPRHPQLKGVPDSWQLYAVELADR